MISPRLFLNTALAMLLLFLAQISAAHFFPDPLGNGPWTFETFEEESVTVSMVTRGLNEGFGLVFIPGTASDTNPLGDILFTERRTGLSDCTETVNFWRNRLAT